MGNEFGHPEWIDFPREGNGFSYHHARRRWDLADNPSLKYKYLEQFDVNMHRLDDEHAFCRVGNHQWVVLAHAEDHVVAFERGDRLLFVFNFHPTKSYSGYRVGTWWPGKYRVVLDTDSWDTSGQGRVMWDVVHETQPGVWHGRPHSLQLYLPCRTAQVYYCFEVDGEAMADADAHAGQRLVGQPARAADGAAAAATEEEEDRIDQPAPKESEATPAAGVPAGPTAPVTREVPPETAPVGEKEAAAERTLPPITRRRRARRTCLRQMRRKEAATGKRTPPSGPLWASSDAAPKSTVLPSRKTPRPTTPLLRRTACRGSLSFLGFGRVCRAHLDGQRQVARHRVDASGQARGDHVNRQRQLGYQLLLTGERFDLRYRLAVQHLSVHEPGAQRVVLRAPQRVDKRRVRSEGGGHLIVGGHEQPQIGHFEQRLDAHRGVGHLRRRGRDRLTVGGQTLGRQSHQRVLHHPAEHALGQRLAQLLHLAVLEAVQRCRNEHPILFEDVFGAGYQDRLLIARSKAHAQRAHAAARGGGAWR
eukprot:ctg_766.g155